jgi:RNA polymerase-binding protein DksA
MAKPAPKKSTAKAAPAPKQVKAVTKAAAKKTTTAKAPAPAAKAPATKAPATKAAAKVATKAPDPAAKPPAKKAAAPAPAKKAASPFDAKFLEGQRQLLLEERAKLLGQAENLEGEAAALMENLDPGDVQFDDESGEGDSLVVERERDLALSAQARAAIEQIDVAVAKIHDGTYGHCENCGTAIPKERLKALPYAALCVKCKSGGLGLR